MGIPVKELGKERGKNYTNKTEHSPSDFCVQKEKKVWEIRCEKKKKLKPDVSSCCVQTYSRMTAGLTEVLLARLPFLQVTAQVRALRNVLQNDFQTDFA